MTPKPPQAPTLSISLDDKNMAAYSGSAEKSESGKSIRICVNDLPSADAKTATIGKDGTFKGGSNTFSVKPGDSVVAQECTLKDTQCTAPYGPVSVAVPINSGPLVVGNAGSKPIAIIIGGVEYGGYSSQAQQTDGFLNIFYRGPVSKSGFSGWARVRLTNAPQQATNGVVSLISNPTGLTTYNYSNVGQVLDYVFGPSWKIPKTEHWNIIAGVGAITPLSDQSTPVIFTAPAPGTQECLTLVNRFSVQNGYNPGLSLNTAKNPATCLAGGYTAIAFSNQDRTNFLMKYGAGVRTSYPLLGPHSYASVDATLGQDSSVTAGYLRGVVFKVDAIMPIPTGSASWLYLFGSSYMRLQRNTNFSPLILATPSPLPIVPSPSVVDLPLKYPNRDYYRIGVGLNITQLWCSFSSAGCSKTTADSGSATTTPKIDNLSKITAQAGASDLTITVTGSNFLSGSPGTSTVVWTPSAGSASSFKPTSVTPTQLTVVIPASNLKTAGSVKVTVNNGANGGASNALPFTITK